MWAFASRLVTTVTAARQPSEQIYQGWITTIDPRVLPSAPMMTRLHWLPRSVGTTTRPSISPSDRAINDQKPAILSGSVMGQPAGVDPFGARATSEPPVLDGTPPAFTALSGTYSVPSAAATGSDRQVPHPASCGPHEPCGWSGFASGTIRPTADPGPICTTPDVVASTVPSTYIEPSVAVTGPIGIEPASVASSSGLSGKSPETATGAPPSDEINIVRAVAAPPFKSRATTTSPFGAKIG